MPGLRPLKALHSDISTWKVTQQLSELVHSWDPLTPQLLSLLILLFQGKGQRCLPCDALLPYQRVQVTAGSPPAPIPSHPIPSHDSPYLSTPLPIRGQQRPELSPPHPHARTEL